MRILHGFAASEGIAHAEAFVLRWTVPEVPHVTVPEDRVLAEVERFRAARDWATAKLREIRERARGRLGDVEARIFDPQLLMLEDQLLVEGTERYIRENRLTAARAFDFRTLELKAMWNRTQHPMVLDRLNDLEDLQVHLLHRMLDLPDPGDATQVGRPVVMLASNLTPSLLIRMEPGLVRGLVTEHGTRTSHWAILARSLAIPAVVGVNGLLEEVCDGTRLIVDGRTGRVVADPTPREIDLYERRRERIAHWETEIGEIRAQETVTRDGRRVTLRVNLDLPGEVAAARDHGAEGIGLFRTEFLVVGRSTMPDEDEQYEAYKSVLEAFAGQPVMIRTFDLGGDKFPLFLQMPPEGNPFLGWRAIRLCLDRLDIFRPQLRALLRASAHSNLRIMLPMINTLDEVAQVRRLLEEEAVALEADEVATGDYQLGVMIETPAAALSAAELARHVDFLSIGTNDLVQYALAVDRTSAKLSRLYDPFHPSVLRLIDRVSQVGREAGLEVSVCGELAANPLGAFMLMGLDITALSVAWHSMAEIKAAFRVFSAKRARTAARHALEAERSREVIQHLMAGIGPDVDLSVFS
jgi:phosphotransferase system enzyme I (PtsI)